jgi:glutamate-1-semialdehyde 2,1-aminomutase/spore coat polysaccharide biosynthesis protein SpsF
MKNAKTIAIIQARMNSTRLPGKVLAEIGGIPVLRYMVERVKRANTLDGIVVATSVDPIDDPVFAMAEALGVIAFRGNENDVLDRYYRAAQAAAADVVVRLTADCPFADPEVIDAAVALRAEGGFDYAGNAIKRSFPDGLDVEVFTREALERAARDCKDPKIREHVTPFLRTGAFAAERTGQFKVGHLLARGDFSHLRWTLDTPEDLEFFRRVVPLLQPHASWLDILSTLTRHPELFAWNRSIRKRVSPLASPGKAAAQMSPRSAQHLARALETIPLGSQTFSKSYLGWVIGVSPLYAESGKGAMLKDIDGNTYVDYVMALLPVVLGYADPDVDAAVIAQLDRGIVMSLATTLEAELAERLVSLIPCAEMVRFGKNGSDATTAAIRLARAFTGRDLIMVAGYHGWHDWYIGTTDRHRGVPEAVRKLTMTFPFNDADALEAMLKQHGDATAAIMLEPTGKVAPAPGYLERVRELADRYGVVLVFDEIITGFRVALGGAQAHYGVTPDLACFGKAMANGMPIAAVVGRRDIMQLMEKVFVSTTFGGETLSLAASIATIDKLARENAISRTWALGDALKTDFNGLFEKIGFGGNLKFVGDPWWPRLEITNPPVEKPLFTALLRQEFNRAGLLIASSLNLSLAHGAADIKNRTMTAAEAALGELRRSIDGPDPAAALLGRVAQSDFAVRA